MWLNGGMANIKEALLAASRWELFEVKAGTTVQKDGAPFVLPTDAMILDLQGYNAMMEAVNLITYTFSDRLAEAIQQLKRDQDLC